MKKVQRRHFKNAFSILQEIKRQNVALETILLFFYGTMDKFEQGYLNPKLEVPRLTCFGRELNPQASTVRGGEHPSKELFEQLYNSYLDHLHMSLLHGSPQCTLLHEHT
jgi:hypothetical protein